MNIRRYSSNDCSEMAELFYNTVHFINCKDYKKAQLDAWATGNVDLKEWDKRFLKSYTVVAVDFGAIAGFCNINSDGYVDMLYVHKDYQQKHIATALLESCENYAKKNGAESFYTHASVTAEPFFKKKGYIVLRKQTVERSGIKLCNYVMKKKV